MHWGSFWTGIIIIAIGFFVKAFPNLISGYNMMSQQEKDKIDIKGFSTALRNLLIVWGVIFAVGYNVLIWMGWEYIARYISIVFVISLIVCMFLFQVIYTIKKKKE